MALVICIFLSLCVSVFGISNQRLCVDAKCKVPISHGSALVTYVPSEGGKLFVKKGDKVTIYSKEAGNDTSLWGVEVGGKRGYMPKSMIKEEKVFHKTQTFIVPTEPGSDAEADSLDNNVQEGSAADVPIISDSFSVVDGTTIYSNTTGEVLETQPMETRTFDTQTLDIQSSRTIDATGIGKNTLVEPNSSLILPQPTTSSAAVYSARGDENLGGTQASVLDEVKSTIETSALESNEDLTTLKVNDIENNSGDVENNENNEKVGIGEDTLEDEEGEEDDEYEEMEDDEDEDEIDDEDLDEEEVLESETDSKQDVDGESERIGKESKEASQGNGENENVVSESSETNLQDSNVSEPEMFNDNTGSSETSEGEQVRISNDYSEIKHEGENKDEGTLVKEEISNRTEIVSEVTTAGPLDKNEISSQNSLNDIDNVGASTEESVVLPNDSESTIITQNANNDEKKYVSEISSGDDASPENNANLIRDSDSGLHTNDASTNSNVSNVEDIQERNSDNEKENYSNSFFSLGTYNENNKPEDDNVEIVQKTDASVSEENIEMENSQDNENTFVEHVHTTPSPFDGITDLHTSTSDQVPENEQLERPSVSPPLGDESHGSEDTAEETLNEDVSDSDGDADANADAKPLTIDAEDMSPEVQGTCEIHSTGCVPETEDLPKQQFSSDEAEPGWLSSLMRRASLRSEFVVSTSINKEMHKNSFDTLLYLMVTAITVLVFSLGYYYLEKQRRDGSLIAKINSLEKALMVTSQEKYTLKDELESAKEKISAFITSIDSGETSSVLKEELEECRNARIELEEQVATLEKELEAATETGLELNRMMSELLSAQHGSDTLMKSVDYLQKELDSQKSTITTMTANLTAKNKENENLQSELKVQLERVQNLEEQLDKVNETLMNLQKEKSEIEHEFQMKNQSIESQLVEALESKSADSQRLCRELDALQDVLDETRKTLAAREGEVSVLRDCLNHAENLSNGGESSVSLEELLNVGHLRAKIDAVTKERDELQDKLQGEEDARKLLEDHMKIISEEVSTLRTKYEEADRGKMEAQTRLEVLSNYFKEKETQLQKELGLQEAMYIQKEGAALSTIEQIKAFQEEIENYKAQNEILKKEILDQERSMKSQIAVLEKKAHENWVAARQAERRMEESKQEASQLRNRLTMSGRRLVGTIPGPDVGKPPDRGTIALEHNGEMSSSPAHMGETQELPSSPLHFGLPGSPPLLPPGGQPLPPGPFPSLPLFLPPGAPGMPFPMPPPPGGLFPDDLRPPPLGRMSSPPPEPHGSFSPFEHSPPMSPPNRPYRSPPHYEDSPSRYRHQTPPTSSTPSYTGPFSPGKWDERGDPPRSSFRPLHRDPPREPKGSTLSSGHSSESLDKGSRHSRV
ncbi:hypothetical protein R5R35_008249 [Gryllus longicercus]|uniref:SH3 domain-containing protein n=1 Tax=Gryllus longicercus TaxID=2509291 RepID=A0AAN9YWX3_9ORTH